MTQGLRVRLFTVAVLFAHASIALAQGDRARVMGTVIDTSGGALPGVTVTVAGAPIKPVEVITDGSGRYLTPWLPPGTYNVSFALSGFESRLVPGLQVSAGQTLVLDQQLPVAVFSETVEVKAPAPPPPPAPKPPAPPRPKFKPVEELLASVCGPRQPPEYSLSKGHIVSHRDDPDRQLLGPGDVLRIDAGENQGLKTGENYVVRSRFLTGDRSVPKKMQTHGEQTAGLVQIMDTQASSASAIIVYACSEIVAGDSIETYTPQPASYTVAGGAPNFDEPAKIAFGEHDRNAAAAGQMMVIDRGMMQGLQRGQRITIFRRPSGNFPVTIGDGVVVAVRPDSATIRIDQATDAVYVGDYVALHR